MATFTNSIITAEGAALIGEAVRTGAKLVITRAKSGSSYDMDRNDLVSKNLSWFDGPDGSISAVAVDGSLQAVASWSGIAKGTLPIKSVGICVQKAKDGDSPVYSPADDILLALASDDNSGYLSGNAFSIKFDLPIALSGVVDPVTPPQPDPDYVTLDTEQTIGAHKTFVSYVTVENDGGGSYTISPEDEELAINDLVFSVGLIPLGCEYSTASKTVDLTLGNGTKIRLTCTNVEEVSE